MLGPWQTHYGERGSSAVRVPTLPNIRMELTEGKLLERMGIACKSGGMLPYWAQ